MKRASTLPQPRRAGAHIKYMSRLAGQDSMAWLQLVLGRVAR